MKKHTYGIILDTNTYFFDSIKDLMSYAEEYYHTTNNHLQFVIDSWSETLDLIMIVFKVNAIN